MSFFTRLAKKNRPVDEKTFLCVYEKLIEDKILDRYSVKQELAILRQRDTKPEEFAEYNAYVEACKAEAKEELGITNSQ